MPAIRDVYLRRHAAWSQLERRLEGGQTAAWWASVVAALGLVLTIALATQNRVASAWVVAPILVLATAVAAEAVLRRRGERARRGVALYERNLARLGGDWPSPPFTGAEFAPAAHRFALDLDLVGERSLFVRLSTARTRAGAEALAGWLLEPSEPGIIRARHEAIEELRGALDLREAMALAGKPEVAEADLRAVEAWSLGPPALPPGLRWPLALLAAGVTITVGGAALGAWGALPPLAALSASGLVHLVVRRRVGAVAAGALEPLRQLSVVAGLLVLVEDGTFRSPLLREVRDGLVAGGRASDQVRALDRHVRRLLSARVDLFAAVAYPLLWPARSAIAIEGWRARNGARLGAWLRSLGTFEALCSIATYADEHPDDPYPELADGGPIFDAEGLGHPLLSEEGCVRNDLSLGGDGPQLVVLSGSNMAGKSTLIRAVGLNAALALAGAPVRARRLTIAVGAIGASVRVHDSVLEGASRFQAEVARLRAILDASAGGPTLFLLDELLSGTHSADRLAGAHAVLTTLVERGAIGLCSTHDLALTQVVDALGRRAANAHLRETLRDGTMTFDYTLRPGVIAGSNAIELLRAVGIEAQRGPSGGTRARSAR